MTSNESKVAAALAADIAARAETAAPDLLRALEDAQGADEERDRVATLAIKVEMARAGLAYTWEIEPTVSRPARRRLERTCGEYDPTQPKLFGGEAER